ncbi:bifunctional adenosylcobinamide kinase/adenosylcobinamide-phosphate guanylyltransferase [Pontibaca salina]|uniref:Bifunctional adenosylcobalamin biosynthesis protein n=1 Tax=Pontibaca salina TaxID=2795731 RepID=A0A934LZ64_9RHOB|nr:bifunctional adenosylcobinamide kinase/adenosylcobinamide-phosphate guanylyltransferase [Pontibaca salina]MBI6628675.1 bifunctional adenosylcobinamide kinase/adenosylcobinamide-phosphate guanylyltransferase [Pontibaca salina]
MLSSLTFVLGGAASGKSAYAENLIENSGLSMTYLATAQGQDSEMRAKIAIHAKRRSSTWSLIEAPLDVTAALASLEPGQICLFDCATLWLSNQMMAKRDLTEATTELLQSIATCRAPLVIVSNEVGQGIVPADAMTRQFREAQGRLNIALAARADVAVLVVAGLPLALKGTLP